MQSLLNILLLPFTAIAAAVRWFGRASVAARIAWIVALFQFVVVALAASVVLGAGDRAVLQSWWSPGKALALLLLVVLVPLLVYQAARLWLEHVAKLLSILRKHGFVKSVRGQQGGYRMARPPQEILVRDLLEALGGRLYDSGFCLRHAGLGESCVHETDCTLRPLWGTVQNAVDRVIAMITLQDLLDGKVDSPNAVMQGLPPRRATASATSERS